MSDTTSAAPSERDLFEAWMRGRGLVHAIGWSAKFCEYELAETQARWITWQAARRAPQPVAREPQPALDCHHRPPCDECAALAAQEGK